jgi:hypothetical protein
MWDAGPGEHPDEGTIHAWLDGALDAASAERVEAHVRGCAACSALTAEARGLIAGATRVVAALDDVPAGTRPVWAQSDAGGAGAAKGAANEAAARAADRSLWRRLRVTPARAAIAATIIVALGLTLTHERAAKESYMRLPAGHSEPRAGVAGGVAAAPSVAPYKDATLDSAVARNLAIAQGRPSVEAARTQAIPQAPPPGSTPVASAPMAMSEQRVAVGRAAVQALRDTEEVAPDKLRVGSAAGASAARAADEVAVSAPARKELDALAQPKHEAAAKVSVYSGSSVARSCYSLESTQGGAMWGDQPLPLVVVVDSGPAVGTRNAALRSGAAGTEVRAAWERSGKDSVTITLQRVGMTGTIALGPEVGGRAGTAASGEITAMAALSGAREDADTRARAKSLKPPPAPNAEPAVAPGMAKKSATALLHVTLRPITCPPR